MATASANSTAELTASGNHAARTLEAPAKPKKMKTPAETRRIQASGRRLPRTMPTPIPMLSATTIPAVVPSRTAIESLYRTARLMVASCVLSPSSASVTNRSDGRKVAICVGPLVRGGQPERPNAVSPWTGPMFLGSASRTDPIGLPARSFGSSLRIRERRAR
jgi:hypothetical protein